MYNLILFSLWRRNEPISQKRRSAPQLMVFASARPLPQEGRSSRDAAGSAESASPPNPVFSRRQRLSRPDLSLALNKGRRFSSEHFTITTSPHQHGYAVVVPKKVARLSVRRHLIKRRVSEALRSLSPLLPASLIVFVRSTPDEHMYDSIRMELESLLSKIKN